MPQIRILTSNSSRTVLDGLASRCAGIAGVHYDVRFDSAKAMLARIEISESGDIAILDSQRGDTARSKARGASSSSKDLQRIPIDCLSD